MQLRYELGMTHDQFSKKIGASPRTLRRWEAGQRDPAIKYIKRMADNFGIEDLYQFMYGEKPAQIPQLMYIP